MSAQVVALRDFAPPQDPQRLMEAVVELHALVSLDRMGGATPARAYFVFNAAAKARIARSLDPAEPACRRAPSAYALVAYDFPFALHSLRAANERMSAERTKEVVAASAGLQGETLRAAAGALGVVAQPVLAFDARALKAAFFPDTQETLTHLFRLELDR